MNSSDYYFTEELEKLREHCNTVIDKSLKIIKRNEKIFEKSDIRQKKEYDELQRRLVEVKELSAEIIETQKEVVFIMGAIAETRSNETGNHVKRVAEYSKTLGLLYGLNDDEAELLKQASPMHDIGKIGIPDIILNKPGIHTDEERIIMMTHAELGYSMLKHSKRAIMKAASIIAHEHHEKWDGTGYPKGLKEEDIHIYARITAVADVFDALGSERVYKKKWEDERIFDLFSRETGKHFDPKLINLFFENVNVFLAIRDSLQDENSEIII